MSDTLLRCIERLKEITTEQGEHIATVTANLDNSIKSMNEVKDELKQLSITIYGQNVRLSTVEKWQENYEKSDNRKIMIGCGLVGLLNILVSVILVVGFR